MNRFIAILAGIGLVVSAPVLSQADPAPAPSTRAGAVQSAAKTGPDGVRCVRIQETGSRVRASKVCKTNAEWNRLADAGNKQASDMVEASRIASIQGQ